MKWELIYTLETEVHLGTETSDALLRRENVFISYHWFNADKSVYAWDYKRFTILRMYQNYAAIMMDIELPSETGTYYFQADIVEEGVRWFSGTGLLASELYEVNVV